MFTPVSHWVAPNLSELPSWEGQERVGVDTEFKDPTIRKLGLGARRGAKIAGYSFAFEDGRKFYVPVRHPEGNVDCEQGFNYLRHEAKHFKGQLAGANLPTELDMLETTEGITFPQVSLFKDVLVLDPLLWELHRSYSLENTSHRWGFSGKDEAMLKTAAQDYGADISKDTWKWIIPDLPAKYVGPYGEEDALLPLRVLREQEKEVERTGMWECWDLECRVLPVLLRMRQRGVRIDFDHLDKVELWARQQEKEALDEIFVLTNVRISPGDTMKTNACVPVFASIGVQVPMKRSEKTGKMGYSLDKEFLGSLAHPVAVKFLYARKMYKLYSTFVASVRLHATNGRLHTTFRQIIGANEKNEKSGAAFGRLSSCKPNLQQQPSRAKFANFFRKIYLPEAGMRWGCLDFSQQEPRWTTHFAALLGLQGAREAAAEYHNNVKLDNHDFMSKLTGIERKFAKEIFLGLCYGEGGAKMCRGLKLPTRWCVRYRDSGSMEYFETKAQAVAARRDYEGEASYYEVAGEVGQAILDKFNDRAPYIRELAKKAEKRVRDTGVIRVLGGRVIHFPIKPNGEYDWSYKGLNRLIQGTSGMQVKIALVTLAREMPDTFIQLQVHDELDGSFHSISEMKKVAKVMRESGGKTHVPFRIDIEHGPNWGTLEQVCGEDTCEHTVDKALEINGTKETYWCPEHARKLAA